MKDYTTVNKAVMTLLEKKFRVQSFGEGTDSDFIALQFHDHIIRTC